MKKTSLLGIGLAAVMLATGSVNAATVLRFSYETPKNDSQHIGAEEFARLVKERSKGELELRLFPGGTLGDGNAMISGVRGGTIDMSMNGSSMFTGMVPELNVLDLPFMFKSRDHVYATLDGPIGEGLLKKLEAHNMISLAYWENGMRCLTNSKHPVKVPADVAGLKVRTTSNPAHIEAFKLLGANPVPMPLSELYTALETKTVDAQEHPINVLWSAKLYEVQKYLSVTDHAYSALIVNINKDKFNSLSKEHQDILRQAALDAAKYQRKYVIDSINEIIENLKKAGLEVITDIDKKPFADAVAEKTREAFIKANGDDLPKAIDELGKQF